MERQWSIAITGTIDDVPEEGEPSYTDAELVEQILDHLRNPRVYPGGDWLKVEVNVIRIDGEKAGRF